MRVAVIGAGISGLTAAWHLHRNEPGIDLVIFDKALRPGGVIDTINEAGFQVELSADNFITTVPWGLELCNKLGVEDELVTTNPECRRTYVLLRGKMYALPAGFLMLAPARIWPMALTPLLSPAAKLRAAMEYFIPPKRSQEEESLAQFVTRRFGRQLYERLVEPLVAAVYAADVEKLSLQATLPQFRQWELEHGSLIRAMRRRRKSFAGSDQSGARYSMFVTLRSGLRRLIDELVRQLPPASLRLGMRVEQIHCEQRKWHVCFSDLSGGLGRDVFDALLLAVPAFEAALLLADVSRDLSRLLSKISYQGTAVLALVYSKGQIRRLPKAAGLVVPAVERSPILAVSFSSQKYTHRAPEGSVLLRVFAGGARAPEVATMSEQELLELLLPPLEQVLQIEGKPQRHWVANWPATMPQYELGHRQLIAQIEETVEQLPHLQLAGNAYSGVGIPHCIRRATIAAEKLLCSLKNRQG